MAGYGNTPFGLNQITIIPAGGGSAVALEAAQEMQCEEETQTAQLEGNDTVIAAKSTVRQVKWSLKGGGISAEALAALTGRSVTVTGSGSTEKTKVSTVGGVGYGYCKVQGKSLGDSGSDIHVILYKCQVTKVTPIAMKYGEYQTFACEGVAIADTGQSNLIMDVIQNKTAAALPTT